MRLVDTDEIEWEYKCISKEEIDELPTVEAIPIEWISKYSRGELSSSDYWAIIRMVGDWRKENE